MLQSYAFGVIRIGGKDLQAREYEEGRNEFCGKIAGTRCKQTDVCDDKRVRLKGERRKQETLRKQATTNESATNQDEQRGEEGRRGVGWRGDGSRGRRGWERSCLGRGGLLN